MKVTNASSQNNTQFGSEQQETTIECFRCGICCMKYQVCLSTVEAHRIADYLGLPFEEFLDKYTDRRWPGLGSVLRQLNGMCAFLDFDPSVKRNNCRIQSVKPEDCRDWIPGLYRPECLKGLAQYWQLTVNLSGQFEGSEERLREFQSFLKSLTAAGKTESNP